MSIYKSKTQKAYYDVMGYLNSIKDACSSNEVFTIMNINSISMQNSIEELVDLLFEWNEQLPFYKDESGIIENIKSKIIINLSETPDLNKTYKNHLKEANSLFTKINTKEKQLKNNEPLSEKERNDYKLSSAFRNTANNTSGKYKSIQSILDNLKSQLKPAQTNKYQIGVLKISEEKLGNNQVNLNKLLDHLKKYIDPTSIDDMRSLLLGIVPSSRVIWNSYKADFARFIEGLYKEKIIEASLITGGNIDWSFIEPMFILKNGKSLSGSRSTTSSKTYEDSEIKTKLQEIFK